MYACTLLGKPLASIASNKLSAVCGCPPFPHALIATVKVTALGASPCSAMESNKATADSHCPARSHAEMAELKQYMFGCTCFMQVRVD